MPDYDAWNHAFIEYFVEQTPPGAPVFLAVDDDALAEMGARLLATSGAAGQPADPVRDFERAVRVRVVREQDRVDLQHVDGWDVNNMPRCVAFLGALVLAASRMRDTGEIDDVNYFTRLRDILKLPGEGRPRGMERGAKCEEPLWKRWNYWLQVQGRLPTATPGPEGPQRYIHYARSQALLRDADKDKLRDLFQARGWRTVLDAETLLLRVRREAPYLTAHLREILDSDSRRLAVVADAIHELYEGWRLDPTGALTRAGRSRTLYAGLYRAEDPLAGTVTYHLYPHMARGRGGVLQARVEGSLVMLRPERARWYYPLPGPVDGPTLATGARYPIEQSAEFGELVLPARKFWVLVPDPDMPDAGAYATWDRPELGQPFILLCQESALREFESLVKERLIEYREPPVPVLDGWYEAQDCYVVSEAWSSAHLSTPDLYEALRPADRCNVILSGGLRVPNGPGWLDSTGPAVAVSGFAPEAELIVLDANTEHVILERTQRTGEPVPVDWPAPGAYLVIGRCAGQEARRVVTITGWDTLHLTTPSDSERDWIPLGTRRLCGAALE